MAKLLKLLPILTFGLMLCLILWQANSLAQRQNITDIAQQSTSSNHQQEQQSDLSSPFKINAERSQPSRILGSSSINLPFNNNALLERLEPLAQPTPPAQVSSFENKIRKPRERWRLVHNAVATSAGVFQTTDLALILPAIDILSNSEKCRTLDGKVWACGMVARTSLRNFINGRALTCKLPEQPKISTFETDCRLRGKDIAQWLVENGWARAKPEGPYFNDQKIAEQTKRGIFGDPPKVFATAMP